MNFRKLLFPISCALLLLFSVVGSGQGLLPQSTQETVVAAQDSARIVAFSATEITEAFSHSNALISESGKRHLSGELQEAYRKEVDTAFSVIDHFLGDSTLVNLEGINVRELNQISQRAEYYLDILNRIQERLAKEALDIEVVSSNLQVEKKRWELTLLQFTSEEMIEERLGRIQRTIHRLDSIQTLLKGDMSIMLALQDNILDKKNDLDILGTRVKQQKALLGERLFSKEMPGFFKDIRQPGDSAIFEKHIAQMRKTILNDRAILKAEYTTPAVVVSILFFAFLAFAIWYKRNFARLLSVDRFELSDMHMAIVYSPAVTVIFIVALLIRFIFSDLPRTFHSLNIVILMVPMAIIIIRLFGSQLRTWILLLITLGALTSAYELSYYQDTIQRVILMALSLTGLGLFTWIFVKQPLANRFEKSFIYRLFRILILVFAMLLLISIIANLIGAVSLAEFLTLLPIQITVLALVIQVTVKVADTLIFLFLASNYAQKVNVIREEFEVIYKKTIWLVDLFLWIFFFSTALSIFRIKDEVFEWGMGVLTNGFHIGAVDITLGNILIFIFVIWLSIMITRMASHILEKDVFTRVQMAKGVPSTVILLMRIVLVTGGFFLAAAAAGMKLTNLSIVLGAFSVGIGFGLQNIFNNMVSGLILAFERPIKVGDTVQVGELVGIVRSIGLRSSTVRSYDGAEVIVPNGNLISKEMINWTKSDSNRRIDISIGVAYGTNPLIVMDIIEEIAKEHPKVKKNPAPTVLFSDFGNSSLDFRLLAWVNVDYKLGVESDIRFELNKRLAEAGIEIPFPQTDLHLRSDFTKGAPDEKSKAMAKMVDSSKTGKPKAGTSKAAPGRKRPTPRAKE